ncbi:MAG: HTH domain-containing protein [Proteobacteria bacterium]|nr:HTH domain-containing protein [Pseudomonadota bacterium]
MFTTSTVFFLILLTLPVVFILWLTESQPQKIKRLYKTGRFTQQQLADKFGVSRTTIRRRLAAA